MAFLFGLDTSVTPYRWSALEVDAQGRLEISSIATGVTAQMAVYDGTAWQNLAGSSAGKLYNIPFAWDGSAYQNLLVESATNKNLRTAIYDGANKAAVDTAGRLSTLLYGYDGTAWQNLLVESATYKNLRVKLYSGTSSADIFGGHADGMTATWGGIFANARLYGFNGTTWDRIRGDITNGLDVDVTRLPNLPSASTGSYGTVSVGATATVIAAANSARKSLIIRNTSTGTVYIGYDSSVTTSNGFPVAQKDAYEINQTNLYTGAVYGIVASGTSDVRKMET